MSCSPDAHLLLRCEKTLELPYVLTGGVVLKHRLGALVPSVGRDWSLILALSPAQVSCSHDADLLLLDEKTLELRYVLAGGAVLRRARSWKAARCVCDVLASFAIQAICLCVVLCKSHPVLQQAAPLARV